MIQIAVCALLIKHPGLQDIAPLVFTSEYMNFQVSSFSFALPDNRWNLYRFGRTWELKLLNFAWRAFYSNFNEWLVLDPLAVLWYLLFRNGNDAMQRPLFQIEILCYTVSEGVLILGKQRQWVETSLIFRTLVSNLPNFQRSKHHAHCMSVSSSVIPWAPPIAHYWTIEHK